MRGDAKQKVQHARISNPKAMVRNARFLSRVVTAKAKVQPSKPFERKAADALLKNPDSVEAVQQIIDKTI